MVVHCCGDRDAGDGNVGGGRVEEVWSRLEGGDEWEDSLMFEFGGGEGSGR